MAASRDSRAPVSPVVPASLFFLLALLAAPGCGGDKDASSGPDPLRTQPGSLPQQQPFPQPGTPQPGTPQQAIQPQPNSPQPNPAAPGLPCAQNSHCGAGFTCQQGYCQRPPAAAAPAKQLPRFQPNQSGPCTGDDFCTRPYVCGTKGVCMLPGVGITE